MRNNVDSKSYFAQVANKWDDMRSGYFTEHMRDEAIRGIDLQPGYTVADIGCGTGFMIYAIAPNVKQVTGFDQSAEMIEKAAENLSGFKNVLLVRSDGDSLPVKENSFDAVSANMYLHHTHDPLVAIKEIFRIVRPGGKILLIDMDLHTNEWMREEMADVWLGFSRKDVLTWLSEAGFKNSDISCAKGSCCTVSPEGRNLEIGIFVAIGEK